MRKIFAFTAAVALTLSLTGLAAAQSSAGSPGQGGMQETKPAKTPTDQPSAGQTNQDKSSYGTTGKSGSAGMPGKSGSMGKAGATGSVRAQNRVTGEVTKIDESKGMISIKTDQGDMELHFPPSALHGIKQGDRVEVQLGLRAAGAAGTGKGVRSGASASSSDDGAKSPAAPGAEKTPASKQPGIGSQPSTGPGSPKSP